MKKQTREIIERVYHHQRKRIITITIILCIILCILMALSMMLGNTFYSLNTVIQSLLYENIPGASFTVNTLRFPRMLAGVFCGLASVSYTHLDVYKRQVGYLSSDNCATHGGQL